VNIRQQSEQWVVAHPKFKECFSSDAFGNKIWNMSHPLTQAMGAILNTTDPITGKMVKDRPDGLRVAAEMAYGRLMLSNEPKAIGQVNQLKKDLRKVQKQTIVQGGGTPQAVSPKSPVRKHLESYTKTYSKNDIKSATKDFLLASGLIKED
jgi:hypothetical protein